MQSELCDFIHLATCLNAKSFDYWVQYLAHIDEYIS